MRIAIATLGCKVNQAESAFIEGILREYGHEIILMPRCTENLGTSLRPDVCIVNTCTVTAKSDYQSRQLIRRAVKSGAKVIVTGCYAQLRADELSKIKGIDLVIGNSQKDKIQEHVYKLSLIPPNPPLSKGGRGDFQRKVFIDSPETPLNESSLRLVSGPYYSNRVRAFLKIQDGCNFSCSYCAVPMARGKSRSLYPEDVLKAVDKFNSEGYKEIVLTGIHIGSYGLDLKPESSLLEIVNKIIDAYPFIRFRLTSIEPQEFKKEFLVLIKNGAVCPHLHIPLQSGSNRILKAMNRGYSTLFFKELVNEIALTCPDISIGTDVIAGFPGESDKDFEDTVRFLEELPLSYIHVFPYSKRPNTVAMTIPEQINNAVKKQRVDKILKIAKKKKNDYISKHLGQRLDVIVEGKTTTNGFYRAISDNYIRPIIAADSLISGQRLQVKAVNFKDGELFCIPVKQS
jgi:threonylcarbamoyladenosine tRNA methylthiotransferase MtaB